jgi:hypothetical protein
VSESEIRGAMGRATAGEQRRRELASQSPGVGAPLAMAQPAAGPSVGKAGLDLPAIGEGYAQGAPYVPQSKSYGPVSPVYAHDLVGGYDFVGGRNEAPVRRHVTNLGADGLFIEGASAPAGSPYVVVSPDAKPGLLRRLAARLLRR